MRKLSRRHFAGSVGAGLLLSPFISLLGRDAPGAGGRQAGEAAGAVLHDGHLPAALDADRSRARHQHLERDDPAALGDQGERRAGRGDAGRQPERRPRRARRPDRPGLRLLPRAQQDLRRPVRRRQAGGRRVNRPIASLLLGAEHQRRRRHAHVLRRRERRQPADHRLAAVGVQHRVRRRPAPRACRPPRCSSAARASSTPSRPRRPRCRARWARTRRPSWTCTSASIRQLENKLSRRRMPAGGTCTKPNAPRRATAPSVHERAGRLAANIVHQNIIVSAFACDITRVAASSTATTRS